MKQKEKRIVIRILAAAVLVAIAMVAPLEGIWRLLIFLIPYAVVGWDVLWGAVRNILRGQVFDENFLMALATVGAFCIGEYPEGVLDDVRASGAQVDAVDALELARQAGSSKAVNIVLMARLAKYFHIPYEKWIAAIEKTVAPKFVDMNKKAFELGYNH